MISTPVLGGGNFAGMGQIVKTIIIVMHKMFPAPLTRCAFEGSQITRKGTQKTRQPWKKQELAIHKFHVAARWVYIGPATNVPWLLTQDHNQNIAKGTTDPRVEFISQVAHKS